MPTPYRGITAPDDTDWADIQTVIRNLIDSALPVGEVRMFAGSAAPAGFLLCNGTAIPAGTTYDALRTLIGANTPDFRGRAPFGPGGFGVTAGVPGGEQTHVLSTGEMPAHAHSGITDTQGNHAHALPSQSGIGSGTNPIGLGLFQSSGARNYNSDAAGNHAHNLQVNNNGGGAAHNNMPPYWPINFIIKY